MLSAINFPLILSVAALFTTFTNAASSSSCSFSKTSISHQTDVSQLNSCPTLDGDITITGNEIASIDLSSLQELKGNLSILNSPSIISLNLNQLKKIDGSLTINNSTQLNSIDLTSLNEANELQLISLPSFATLNLNTGVSSAGKVILSDTSLTNLNGLASFNKIEYMNINNNKNITHIEFVDLQQVSDSLILSFNNDQAEIYLNNLQWCSNLTIQDASEFQAQNLTFVNGSLQFSYNTFTELNLTSLETIGSSLQIFANDDLNDLSLGSLESIGGELKMFNNSELQDMENTFESLKTVKGAVSIVGEFSNLTMPNLDKVAGDFQLNSTSNEFDCKDFDDLHSDDKIQGHNYECSHPPKPTSSESSSKSTHSSASSTSGSSSDSDSSSQKKTSFGNNLVIPTTIVFSAIIGLIITIV